MYWLFDRATGTYLSLAILMLIAGAVSAASFEVYNIPEMTLRTQMNTTVTTGIQINAPTKNSVKITFPAGSGGVLEITQRTRSEHIYYERALVNSTTKVITLTGSVIRDLCYTATRTYTTCSDGQWFTPGAAVRFVDDMRTINLKVNMDRTNTLTASGALKFSGSGSLGLPYFATTTERDRQLGSNPTTPQAACVSATGICYYYLGGAWISFGSGSTVNATESAAGKVQLASTGAMVNHRLTGSTGAAEVLYSAYVTGTGGTTNRWKIPLLGRLGTHTGSLLGIGSTQGSGTGRFLAENGRWVKLGSADLAAAPTESGANLDINVNASGGGALASTVWADFPGLSGTVTASVGDLLMITFKTNVDDDDGGINYDIRVNGGKLGQIDGGANGIVGGLFQQLTIATGPSPEAAFTHFHKVQTGGTLTIAPVYKSLTGGHEVTTGTTPSYFQVIVIK